jgi:hypothetical protein
VCVEVGEGSKCAAVAAGTIVDQAIQEPQRASYASRRYIKARTYAGHEYKRTHTYVGRKYNRAYIRVVQVATSVCSSYRSQLQGLTMAAELLGCRSLLYIFVSFLSGLFSQFGSPL